MVQRFDAVVVGAGINGMVAAAELALAGWRVALMERNERIGGFVASKKGTGAAKGYTFDTYSSWHPQFVSGPAYGVLAKDLHECGLEYANTDDELCATVSRDGKVTVAYRSARRTAAGFRRPEDGRTYRMGVERILDDVDGIGSLLGSELRSLAGAQAAFSLARSRGLVGSERWLRDLATSGRSWCRREFEGSEVERLWIPWLLHAGLSPDHAGGGFMIPMFAANLHAAGLPVVVGGARGLVRAFERLLRSLAVEVVTGVTVDGIVLHDGRAAGVACGDETIMAESAVLASVTPTALYGKLLPGDAVGRQVAQEARTFRYGRGAMQVHVALDAPLAWQDERLGRTPIVHLTDGGSTTGIACAEAEAGLLPARPTVVVGQQHLLDPSRVPRGAAALWIQLLEVPFRPSGDAAHELDVSRGWTQDLALRYAERALGRLEGHVDQLRPRKVEVISPRDLLEYNVNAIDGDPYGGDSQLDQSFIWRPLPSSSGHDTHVPGLWHIGASTHPGAGLSGTSGHMVAQRLISTTGSGGPTPGIVSRLTRRRRPS